MVVQVAGRDRLGRVSEGVGRGYWRQGWGEVLLPLLPPASPALATATATGAVPALPVTCHYGVQSVNFDFDREHTPNNKPSWFIQKEENGIL